MSTATKRWRYLGLLLLLFSIAGTAQAQRTVTLRLNTATLADTLSADSPMQVRGCLDGCEGDQSALPGDDIIAWNDNTTLTPSNAGGDFWDLTFQIPDEQAINFKFYSQQSEDAGIGGWEDGANHNIPAGVGDTTLALHFFEKGDDQPYDWRPFESREDSVGVWFRVYMNTENALSKGYDPDAEQTIGVRGGDLIMNEDSTLFGPLDWGATQVTLTRECDDATQPGYDRCSGVADYSADLVGQEQQYKFFLEPDGWEDGDNRTFNVPAQDTTLQWVYYSNSPPASGAELVTSGILFSVDLTPLEAIGVFDRARGDTLEVRGGFNGWDCAGDGSPDDCLLLPVPGEVTYEQFIPLTSIPGSNQVYKYYLNLNNDAFRDAFGVDVIPSGWEEPISSQGDDREFVFEGVTSAEGQVLDLAFYNDILPQNIIQEGNTIDLTFRVDMAPAIENEAQPFVPGTDSVTVRFDESFWAITQGIPLQPRDDDPGLGDGNDVAVTVRSVFQLTDEDGDNIYEGTFTVQGPTYSGIQYRYAYGSGLNFFTEPGQGAGSSQRRRARFIVPNSDGSWPTEWTFEDVGEEGFLSTEQPMPFEPNPATSTSIETIDSELPSRLTLDQNYPNPFNPTTTFEYSIPATQPVTVRVFDMLGRQVSTLVDGVQSAGTYRVAFDATDLASG
ncbi:MAG: T9SS type A sorting domain-containing protein, partial [Bacteroidota bacterium]